LADVESVSGVVVLSALAVYFSSSASRPNVTVLVDS
jgi:hypothetical protein